MRNKITFLFISTIFFVVLSQHAYSKNIRLFFDTLGQYEVKHYANENKLELRKDDDGNISTITHISDNSASGLFQILNLDLRQEKIRYLNFEWYSEKFLTNKSERLKENHDFPARVYLTFRKKSLPFELPFQLPWEKYHLNYVFSNTETKGHHWKSPYRNFFVKSHDIVLSGKDDPSSYWINHKIDLRSDIQKFWNIDLENLESVALMVDTDNTNKKTKTIYRNIYLSSN